MNVSIQDLARGVTPVLDPRSNLIHVWRANMAYLATDTGLLCDFLSADELARSIRMQARSQRTRFVFCRGLLRLVLGAYLHSPPDAVRIRYGRHGKPFVPERGLRFNLAHSGEYVVYAFSRACEVGIDIERVRPVPAAGMIARYYFSPTEQLASVDHTNPGDARGFLQYWTRKEAYVKARGYGLSCSLSDVHVSIANVDAASLLATKENSWDPLTWSIFGFRAAPEYIAALASSRRLASLSWHELT